CQAVTNRIERASDLHHAAVEPNATGVARTIAEDRFHQLRPSRADQSGESQHLSGIHTKSHVFEIARSGESLHTHYFLSTLCHCAPGRRLSRITDHVSNQIFYRDRRRESR